MGLSGCVFVSSFKCNQSLELQGHLDTSLSSHEVGQIYGSHFIFLFWGKSYKCCMSKCENVDFAGRIWKWTERVKGGGVGKVSPAPMQTISPPSGHFGEQQRAEAQQVNVRPSIHRVAI